MHDAVTGEGLGVPSVGVMTEPFADGAALMAQTLGLAGYRFATIGHPIASASREQLAAWAADVAAQAEDLLGLR